MPNRERKNFNQKRALTPTKPQHAELQELALKVRYGGNPEHKRNPGDFELTPPSALRADKTLCEPAGIRLRAQALEALRKGVLRGLISVQRRGIFPQNIWSVTDEDIALEAQLDNQELGTYHGYPMPEADPLRGEVLRVWRDHERL
ncbi:MAG TPA: hypothetical protein VGE98_02960 [Thermoanaerobaculia bacterium]